MTHCDAQSEKGQTFVFCLTPLDGARFSATGFYFWLLYQGQNAVYFTFCMPEVGNEPGVM